MLPDQVLSSSTIVGVYLFPDSIPPDITIDYEFGGIALNDPSQGLMVQVWTLRLDINPDTTLGTVYLGAPAVPETVQFSGVGITEVSLAFDQNMHPFVAFMQAGAAMFWWFDSLDSTQKFSTLPVGSGVPKCCLDDKNPVQVGASDIILSYVRAGSLYFRAQRDRYLIEYFLTAGVIGELLQVAMTNKNRLQFLVGSFE